MNRAERRREMRTSQGQAFHSTGVKVEAVGKYHSSAWPEPEPGKHLWVMTGAWRVDPEQGGQVHLDTENLLTLEGPGCIWCEEPWTEQLAKQLCKGDVSK